MSSRFVNVLEQALKTFNRVNQTSEEFADNLALLKQLIEQLTFTDFHFSEEDHLNEKVFQHLNLAPCFYIHIFENDFVSMGVFVLRDEYIMPLHDHPMMHGLLRGIYGKLKVKSYTQQFESGESPVYDNNVREIPVIAEEPRIIGIDTECILLTPNERNFHEIAAVDGVAAFFDILSPPYNAEMPIYGSRKCQYYRVEKDKCAKKSEVNDLQTESMAQKLNAASTMRLVPIRQPRWYYCDNMEAPEQLAKSLQSYMDICNYINIEEKALN